MKKTLIILFIFCGFVQANAQDEDKDPNRERIKALKTAFITQEMEFSNKTAQKFWPIYDQYEEERRELHRREHIDLENMGCINEEQAEEMLQEFVEIEKQEYQIKKQLFSDLRQILSAKEIIKLHRLEDEFHKKLIKEYRSRKTNESPNQK